MLAMLVLAVLRLKSNFGMYLPLITRAEIAASALFSFLTASSHFETSRKYFCKPNEVFLASNALLL